MANEYTTSSSIFAYDGPSANFSTNDGMETTLNSYTLTTLFGAPYQFMDTVDSRLNDNNSAYGGVGAKYAQKILGPMDLLMLVPCKQAFMPDFSSTDKSNVLSSLLSGDNIQSIGETINKSGKYYDTEFAKDEYYGQVSMLCKLIGTFCDVADKTIYYGDGSSSKVKDFDAMKYQTNYFQKSFMEKNAVMFYLDGGAELSESFSNSSAESSLASTLNGYSDQVNELRFLIGGDSALAKITEAGGDLSSTIMGGLSGFLTGTAGDVLGKLAKQGTSTIISGGKIIFPKIWQNSEFSRSYNFEIKLRSPDHDNMSIFTNIFIPLMHLIAFALPIQMDGDPNGYKSPFLLKAYCKGFFNIDMGLMTGLSITRGGECQWNDDGLPTQINVSMEIEDLYSTLMLSDVNANPFKSLYDVCKNTALLDYLSNMDGLNVGDSTMGRAVKLYSKLLVPTMKMSGSMIWHSFDNGISNILYMMARRLGAMS